MSKEKAAKKREKKRAAARRLELTAIAVVC